MSDYTEVSQREYESDFVEVIQAAITDLRSGNYAQVTGYLRWVDFTPDMVATDKWCCLGVVCNRVPNGTWGRQELTSEVEFSYQESTSVGSLPRELCSKWDVKPDLNVIPFTDEAKRVLEAKIGPDDDDGVYSLASFNDDGVEFPVIADIMERALNKDGIVFDYRFIAYTQE